jgi:hypothetical protein
MQICPGWQISRLLGPPQLFSHFTDVYLFCWNENVPQQICPGQSSGPSHVTGKVLQPGLVQLQVAAAAAQ